jgi:hypothetical protein
MELGGNTFSFTISKTNELRQLSIQVVAIEVNMKINHLLIVVCFGLGEPNLFGHELGLPRKNGHRNCVIH